MKVVNLDKILDIGKWNKPILIALKSGKRSSKSTIFLSGKTDLYGNIWGKDANGKIRNIGRTAFKRSGSDTELSYIDDPMMHLLGITPKPDHTISLADLKRAGMLGMNSYTGQSMGRSALKDYLRSRQYNKIVRKFTGDNHDSTGLINAIERNKIKLVEPMKDYPDMGAWAYIDKPEIDVTNRVSGNNKIQYAILHESTHRSEDGMDPDLLDEADIEFYPGVLNPNEVLDLDRVPMKKTFINPNTGEELKIFNPHALDNPDIFDYVSKYYATPTEMRGKIIPMQVEMNKRGWSPAQAARLLPNQLSEVRTLRTIFTPLYMLYLLGNSFKKGGKLNGNL